MTKPQPFSIGPNSKLYPFRDLIGKIPDEELAEMSDMKLSTVEKYRRKLGLVEGDGEVPPEAAKTEEAEECAELEEAAEDQVEAVQPPAGTEPESTPAPEVEEPEDLDEDGEDLEDLEPCPRLVRVVRTGWVKRFPPNGMPHLVGRMDLYRGARAAHLWANHRDQVEPFEPQG